MNEKIGVSSESGEGVSNGISTERKHVFLSDFYESLKKILTCVECDGIRQKDSLAFCCGHCYCEICSKNLSSCSKCATEGHQRGSIIKQDHSDLLAVIEKLQKNFNVERIFLETLKFLLTPPHRLKQEDSAMVLSNSIKNSLEISPNELVVPVKHFAHNFKKKLRFSPTASIFQSQISENDSESLFVNSNKKILPANNIIKIESLDLPLSTTDSRNSPLAESPGSLRKRAKRKLSKNYLTDATNDKRCPKRRKISMKPKVSINSDEHCSSRSRTMKKDILNENSSSSFPSSSSIPNALSRNADGRADSLGKFKQMTTRSSRSNSLKNKAHDYNSEEECAKSIANSVGAVKLQMQQSQESGLINRTEIDILDDKQESTSVHQGVSKNCNCVSSLPNPEMEEAIDINSWQHDEKVSRKKKALMFKSVKERNRRKIFFDGSPKLHSTDDHVNFVQLEAPGPSKQPEAIRNSIVDLEQYLPEIMSAKKKDITTHSNELNTYSRSSDSQLEVVSVKIMSAQNRRPSSDLLLETSNESSLIDKSSVGQTCSYKLEVDLPGTGSEEDKIRVLKTPFPKVEQIVTTKSSPFPSTAESMTEFYPPKFGDNSKLGNGPGLLCQSKTYSSVSTEASFKIAEFIPSTETNINKNFKSPPVDDVCTKSVAFIGLLSADDRENHTGRASPSNFPESLLTTYESSSCSVELIKKSSQEIVVTISDADTNSDQNHAREIVSLIPSQPITIRSCSSEDSTSTANKTDQTAVDVESDGTEKLDVASSICSRFKSDDLFVDSTQTKEKYAQLKIPMNERSFDNDGLSPSFIFPEAPSVQLYKGQDISSSTVNFVDLSLEKIKPSYHFRNFPETLTKPSKTDIINSSDYEKSLLFSAKSGALAEEILTVPTSPRSKSVSCQTTSDLHVSLLEQEFPHLFNQQNYGVSVYDTPDKSSPSDSKTRDNLKTPQISCTSRPVNLTAISSVTSSEKKIFENLFTDRSVLDDSSFHCAFIAEKTLDISIQPLPSTGKKVFSAITTPTGEKPHLIESVTFEPDLNVNLKKQKIMNNSIYTASTPHSRIKRIYYSRVNTTSPKGEMDESISNRVAHVSNEAEFVHSGHKNEKCGFTAIKKISGEDNRGNRLNSDDVGVPDQNVILNEFNVVQSTRRISAGAVANRLDQDLKNGCNDTSATNHFSNNGSSLVRDDSDVDVKDDDDDDDDDDVEFIAGTPTSSRRCVDDNLEKLVTQSFTLKNSVRENVSNDSKKDETFSDNNSGNQKSPPHAQSLMDYSQIRPTSLPVPDLPTSEMSDIIQKPSLDLFSSIATNSVQASPSLALVITGLKDADVKLVKLFCQRFSASLLDRITSETTHLVVKKDRKSRTARTFKYLQAIVNSICVISIEWVLACIETNEILNEEKFIPFDSSGECGPLRAYKSRRGVIPSPLSWLCDYCLFFMEPIPSACTLIQLQEIVEKTGAVIVTDLKDFQKYATLHHLIIISDEEESSQTSSTDIANWLQIYQAVAVEFNWLLEVIGRNRMVPFADYELVEIPPNLLLKLNFPNEMLQCEREDVEDSD